MAVTQQQIAEHLGISRQLVGFALNGNSQVSEKTRKRVKAAARKLGYQTNRAACALAGKLSHTIALWSGGGYTPFYAKIIRQLDKELRKDGYQLVVSELETGRKQLELPHLFWPIDGLIVVDSSQHVEAFLKQHSQHGIPCISIGSDCSPKADHVILDIYPALVNALQYFVKQGCRRIASLTPVPVNGKVRADDTRYQAYSTVMQEAGIETELILTRITCEHELRDARQSVLEYIKEKGCPSAIFCHDDIRAMGVFRALYELELKIPQDVMLLGCNGLEEATCLPCSFSTIISPIERMCSYAWQFLTNRFNDNTITQQKITLQASFSEQHSISDK